MSEDLALRARAGDRAAFDELTRWHYPRVYALLFRLVGNHEDAEDLAQECFVRAWRSLGWYRAGSLAAWLARIALHLASDHHRARSRRPRTDVLASPADRQPEPHETSTHRELARELGRALDELPFRLRAALVLRVFEGLDYEEVARATGVTAGTARTHVMKARRVLRRCLAPWLERKPS